MATNTQIERSVTGFDMNRLLLGRVAMQSLWLRPFASIQAAKLCWG
jgi:hypothetical protein